MPDKFSLVARRQHGCIVDVQHGHGEAAQRIDLSRLVLDWTRQGLRVGKLPSAEANRQLRECLLSCPVVPESVPPSCPQHACARPLLPDEGTP